MNCQTSKFIYPSQNKRRSEPLPTWIDSFKCKQTWPYHQYWHRLYIPQKNYLPAMSDQVSNIYQSSRASIKCLQLRNLCWQWLCPGLYTVQTDVFIPVHLSVKQIQLHILTKYIKNIFICAIYWRDRPRFTTVPNT